MRIWIFLALALAACGAPGEAPSAAPEGPELITGAIIAEGEAPQWRFVADPQAGIELIMGDDPHSDGPHFSAAYAPPQQVGDGMTIVSEELMLTLAAERCTANGATFPYRATVQATGQEPVTGCAAERWDNRLLAMMPQIDACIAASPTTRWVTYAGDIGEEGLTVRMVGGEGAIDCAARASGAVIAPRRADLHVPGERTAIFVRGPGDQPGGECYEADEVRSANGELLGWMADPLGC